MASEAAANDQFGYSIAISGDCIIVGAFVDDDNSPASGRAYVFVRTGATWSEQAKLTVSDGVSADVLAFLYPSLEIMPLLEQQATVLVLLQAKHVFMRSGTNWAEQAILTASDGVNGDMFGNSVSISGSYVVVGAEDDDTEQGSVYVFERTGSTWSQIQKLTASDAAINVKFGQSVSISGSSIIIGAPAHDDPSTNADYGRAYIFVSDGTTWTEQQKIFSNDNGQYDWFG